ncbi:MAG: dihydroorotase [Kiritimatiellae bacterium]|nr:dihydroorotase [Kiritimatiellia bacterium]MDD5520926.1 dihydroorotase [Kiritimatiellia bacterium]
MQNSWYIRRGRLVDPSSGNDKISDLYIRDGIIAPLPQQIPPNTTIIDAKDLVIAPGFIDLHVHLREPGNESAETIESGSKAAAKGGFTTIVAMPNTEPPVDTPDRITRVFDTGRRAGFVTVLPSGCITKGRRGKELAMLKEMANAGAVAFTDDGTTVSDDNLMAHAMKVCKVLGKPVFDHALDPQIAAKGVMHDGTKSRQLGLPGIPSLAEVRIVQRDIRLAKETDCAVHIQHVSSAESVDLIRQAISNGIRISGEATPHHIAFADSDIIIENTNFKMNPPLRSDKDRMAILSAVADGTIQVLATDHAPHTQSDKGKGFMTAPFGVAGLETAVGITYSLLVKSGLMNLIEWIRRWTTGPANIIGLPSPGLKIGTPADITILDLHSEWTVNSNDFLSKSRNTPFDGLKLTGQVIYTFRKGKMMFNTSNLERHR